MQRTTLARSTAAAVLLAGAALLLAGPLDPPTGPVAPTYKTLAEIEPRTIVNATNTPGDASYSFKITKPGSYYLTGDITGELDKTGIRISASRVTLDLNGYSLHGINGAADGIHVVTEHGVTIRNGSIYNWSVGIDATETSGIRLENIACATIDQAGFQIGPGGVAVDCVARACSPGFDIHSNATLTRCTARYGPGNGFNIGRGSVLTDCVATSAATGFHITGPAVLTGCAANDNEAVGFRALESAVLSDCSASENQSTGFLLTGRSRATRCVAQGNTTGFYIVEGNAVIECTAASNAGYGLAIVGNANTVERSTFHANGGEGILLSSGRGNSVDGNLATYNTFVGINIGESDNLTVRNRARGNAQGNFLFVANTDYGVVLTNPGQGFNSSAAWANFEF